MRHSLIATLCIACVAGLSACDKPSAADVNKSFEGVNVIDASGLNDVMLNSADPAEAVSYFKQASDAEPDRVDFKRGLALALVRANRSAEAAVVWEKLVANPTSTPQDRVDYASTLIRNGDWTKAKVQLDAVPPTVETFQRYRLEAMVADSGKNWKKADSFYETAVGLTTRPAGVLNNWGYSKLSRGALSDAERLFTEAITYDSSLYTAKNNLVLARGAQKKYTLPIVPMSQVERAQLLYSLALTAVKQGDIDVGRGLLQESIDTHPQHFEEAARALKALDGKVTN